jgi:hypothetical protein
MKRLFAALIALATLTGPVACHTQVPPVTPPQSGCPAITSSAWTQLNPVGSATNPPTTTPTLAVTPSGPTCYAATGYLPASAGVIGQYGATSNVVGPASVPATLSVSCTAGAGQTCSGVLWVFSSAPAATALAPAVPSLSAPGVAQVLKPQLTLASR